MENIENGQKKNSDSGSARTYPRKMSCIHLPHTVWVRILSYVRVQESMHLIRSCRFFFHQGRDLWLRSTHLRIEHARRERANRTPMSWENAAAVKKPL